MLIVQFDGSCLAAGTEWASCGAGIAAWLLVDGKAQLVGHFSVPFPEGRDSAEAEAFAGALSVQIVVMLRKDFEFTYVEFQGDNTSVVNYWEGRSRFRGVRINSFLETAREDALYRLGGHTWRYIPRECNSTADHLAGAASLLVSEARTADPGNDEQLKLLARISHAPLQNREDVTSPVFCRELKLLIGETSLNDFWAQARHDLLHSETFSLIERPSAHSWGILAALRRWSREHAKCTIGYYNLVVNVAKTATVAIEYSTKVTPRQGRMRPTIASAGAKLSRIAGHIIFGEDHAEVDMIGAHLAIFISLVKTHLPHVSLPSPFGSPEQARLFLQERLENTPIAHLWPDYQKRFWSIALNTTNCVRHLMGVIMAANLFGNDDIKQALQVMHEVKLLLFAVPNLVSLEGIPHLAPKNVNYFSLEIYEARYMHNFLAAMLSLFCPNSLILRHDGFYISPMPPNNVLEFAAEAAEKATGLNGIRVKLSSLQPARLQAVRFIASRPVTVMEEDESVFSRLTSSDWWDNLQFTRATANRQVVGQAQHNFHKKRHIAEVDNFATLHKYFSRRRLI